MNRTDAPEVGQLDPAEIQKHFEQLAAEVAPWAAETAERLRALAIAVASDDPPVEWAGVNLYRFFDPDALMESFPARATLLTWIRWVETVRNVLILAPVLVTWYGISQAVSAYHALVAHSLATATTRAALPFLFLWESGFEGRLPAWLTLSRVALYDSILIFLVLALTLLVYGSTSLADGRGRAATTDLGRRLRLALGDAERWLARSRRPETLAQTFRTTIQDLVRDIRAERHRMAEAAEARELELRELRECTQSFADGSRLVLAATQQVGELYGRSAEATTRLGQSIDQLAQSQRVLEAAAASAGSRLEILIGAQESLATQVRSAVGSLSTGAEALAQTVDRVATVAEAMAKTHSELAEPLLASVNRSEASTTLLHHTSVELVAATAQQTAVTRDQISGLVRVTAFAEAAHEQTDSMIADQRRFIEVTEKLVGRLAAIIDQQQALADNLGASLQRELSALDHLSPQVQSTTAIAVRLADAETNLLATIAKEHRTLEHVAAVVGRSAMALERMLQRLQEREKQIFGLTVDLHDISTNLPSLSRSLHEDLSRLVSAHERAADRLEQASQQVASAAGEVHRLVRLEATRTDTLYDPSPPGDDLRDTSRAVESPSM